MKLRYRIARSFLLLGLIFSAAPVFSQKALKTIQGFVTCDGENIGGVKVTPKNFNAVFQTTREGAFSFRGEFVSGKTYLFSLEKVGYKPIAEVGLHASETGYLGTVVMEKLPEPPRDTTHKYRPFDRGEQGFKILIFPFDPFSTCKNTDKYCLENIRDRFFRINEASGFKVAVKTDDRFNIDYPMSYDSARAIGLWYDADMVVWGDYEQQCNWDTSLFNVKFVTLGGQEQQMFKGLEGESRQRIGSFRSIVEEGALTGDIEDVVIWSMAVRQLQQERYDDALRLFKKIDIQPQPEYATVHCLQGWCHTLSGRYEDAYISYDEAERLNGRNPLIFICRGIQYQLRGEKERALRDFERALYLNNSSIEAHLQMSILQGQAGNAKEAERNMLLAMALDSLERTNMYGVYNPKGVFGQEGMTMAKAIDYFQQGNFFFSIYRYNQAIELYKKGLALEPSNVFMWVDLGNAYYHLDAFGETIKCMQRAIEIDSTYYWSLHLMAAAYLSLGKLEESVYYGKKAIEVDSNVSSSWLNLAISYLRMGKNTEALNCINRSIKLKSDEPHAWNTLGAITSNLGQKAECIEFYQKALIYNPKHAPALQNLGIAYSEIGKPRESIDHFKKVIEIVPLEHSLLAKVSELYLMLGVYDSALIFAKKCIEIRSNYHKAWTISGEANKKLKNIDDGIRCYLKAIELKPADYYSWGFLGELYAEIGKKAESVKCYERVTELNPGDHLSWYNLGEAYLSAENHAESIKSFKKVIDMKPNFHGAWANIAGAYSSIQEFEESIKAYEKAIFLKPEDYYSLNELAALYLQIEQADKAVLFANRALNVKSDFHVSWTVLAEAYLMEGKVDSSIEAYKKAISLKPEDYYSMVGLAEIYASLGDYNKSIELFKNALALAPDDPGIRSSLASAYFDAKKYDECINQSDEIIQRKPNYHQAWTMKAACLLFKGDTVASIQNYYKAIELKPEDYYSWSKLADIYLNQSKWEEGIKCSRSTLNIRSDYHRSWTVLGQAYFQLGQSEESVKAYEQAIKLKPNDYVSLVNLGNVLEQSQNLAGAERCYLKAHSIVSALPDDWHLLGVAFSDINKNEQALNIFSKVINRTPDAAYTLNNRGNIYRRLGDLEKAKADVQKSISLDDTNGWAYATLAMIAADEGNTEEFYRQLEVALTKPLAYPLKQKLKIEKTLQKFTNEPRFQKLLEQAKE